MKAFNISASSNSHFVAAHQASGKGKRLVPKTTFYARHGKRMFDLLCVLVLLPIISPIIFVVWVLTRTDGGPGFYSQYRIGMNGCSFRCWKIRTMVMNSDQVLQELCEKDPEIAAEWHKNQKLENDPRITRVGKFLRATSLDELPQLWNVLVGDMSFIGPRPFMASQQRLYEDAGGQAYFHLRPGITGPWQVDGRGVTTFVDRIHYDDQYLKELSFRTDFSLFLKTLRVLLVDHTGH